MQPEHTINLTFQTYKLLEQRAQKREETIDEAIMYLIEQQEKKVDLAIGLDTVPSILDKELVMVLNS